MLYLKHDTLMAITYAFTLSSYGLIQIRTVTSKFVVTG